MNRNRWLSAAVGVLVPLVGGAGLTGLEARTALLLGAGLGAWAVPALADDKGGDSGEGAGSEDGRTGSDDRHGDDSERGQDREGSDRGTESASGLDADDRADDGREFEPDVVLAIDLSRDARIRSRALGFRVIDEETLHGLGFRLTELSTPGGLPTEVALRKLREADPAGTYDLNPRYIAAGTDACAGIRCDAQKAVGWTLPGCNQAVTIGMIDTAVATTSPALAGSHLVQQHFGNSGASAAGAEHGSEIATMFVGNADAGFAGLLPKATVLAANVFDFHDGAGESTNALQLARGFDWLVGQRPAVINVAIAGPDNGILRETVNRAVNGGIPVVAAAGNLGPSGPARYPAAYPQVIAVTAVDRYQHVYAEANQGAYITLAAPGVHIWSADAQGQGKFVDGTSFATPFVSAEVALMHANDARTTPAQIIDTLRRQALHLGASSSDAAFGAGLLQSRACPVAAKTSALR